jgi:hypothetical protein
MIGDGKVYHCGVNFLRLRHDHLRDRFTTQLHCKRLDELCWRKLHNLIRGVNASLEQGTHRLVGRRQLVDPLHLLKLVTHIVRNSNFLRSEVMLEWLFTQAIVDTMLRKECGHASLDFLVGRYSPFPDVVRECGDGIG